MIERYTRPEMGRHWSLENRYQVWLEVELAACDALAKAGIIPIEAAKEIRKKAKFNVQRIEAIEADVKHDVIAFVSSVAESLGPESRFLHYGLTSSDVVDTALALLFKRALDQILAGTATLLSALKAQAYAHKDTLQVGRSHGIHAEPITFGLKLAQFYAELKRDEKRLQVARANISFGKLSGAVGTYAHLPPAIESDVCQRLGLKAETVATQVIPRDRHAEVFTVLAILGGTMERLAVELRHLQRTEVREVEEAFSKNQKGSSAMPHKRNPISSENITGGARLLRSYAQAALENIALWHERDISHSSVERVIAPDATILADYMLHRLAGVVQNLVVYPKRMQENLESTHGLIFSQALLLKLVEKGVDRDGAYRLVQRCAMKVWDEGGDFKKWVLADREILQHVDAKTLEGILNYEPYVRHRNEIFKRIFEEGESAHESA